MEYLDFKNKDRLPTTIQGIRVFLRSLLRTLQFAHSRNVMNRDLYKDNVYFDGKMVKLFDWDDGAIYKPNAVKMRVSSTKMPPEAWSNKSAAHATVSGYDIWNVGLMLKRHLKRREESSINDPVDGVTVSMLNDFLIATLTKDPYKRPDATELLKHPFLSDTAEQK